MPFSEINSTKVIEVWGGSSPAPGYSGKHRRLDLAHPLSAVQGLEVQGARVGGARRAITTPSLAAGAHGVSLCGVLALAS